MVFFLIGHANKGGVVGKRKTRETSHTNETRQTKDTKRFGGYPRKNTNI